MSLRIHGARRIDDLRLGATRAAHKRGDVDLPSMSPEQFASFMAGLRRAAGIPIHVDTDSPALTAALREHEDGA